MTSVSNRLDLVRQRIAAAAESSGRNYSAIKLVAVAKTADQADLEAAWQAGQRDFAHNRLQMLELHKQILPLAKWHMIGPVQGNKAKVALRLGHLIHTVGDQKIAQRFARLASAEDSSVEVLVQVNLTLEDGRYGCHHDDLEELLRLMKDLPGLNPQGLMTLAPHQVTETELHGVFAGVRGCAESMSKLGLLPADPELSMGMSNDFEIAIAEGATLVRVGRAIFPPAQ